MHKCQCKPDCEAAVMTDDKKYARGHNPDCHVMTVEKRYAISEAKKTFHNTGVKKGPYIKKGYVWKGVTYPNRSTWQSARMKDPDMLQRTTVGMIESTRKRMQNPEFLAYMAERSHTPEVSKRRGASLAAQWKNPEYRANQVTKQTAAHNKPSWKKQHSRTMRKVWKQRKYRTQQYASRVESWATKRDRDATSKHIAETIRASYASGERHVTGYCKGYYHSEKMHLKFPYRSELEHLMMVALDSDKNITEWLYEPLSVPYYFEGVKRTYRPDFWYVTEDGKWHIVEVKHSNYMDDQKTVAKRAAAEALFGVNDIEYAMMTEKEINVASS